MAFSLPYYPGKSRFIPCDLAHRDETLALCEGQHAVIHCAALCTPWPPGYRASPAHASANVTATANVVAGCKANGVKRLIHVSTPSLYVSNGA